MQQNYNPREIIEIAIKVEVQGRQFYQELETRAIDTKSKDTWRYLKEQEQEHIAFFHELSAQADSGQIYDYGTGELNDYLNALASNFIFTLKKMESRPALSFSSFKEAIEFAIQVEKESILVYSGLKDALIADKRTLVEKIISEERRHLVVLEALRKQ